jgi:transcriptional regulator with XRE-family HTH domain
MSKSRTSNERNVGGWHGGLVGSALQLQIEEAGMIVGERLKSIRESKGLSQGDIEEKTGLLRCYLSRCENGHTVPSIDTLERWVRALGVSMAQLFAEDGEPVPVLSALKKTGDPKMSREAAHQLHRVEQAFLHMRPRDMRIVSAFASKLARITS